MATTQIPPETPRLTPAPPDPPGQYDPSADSVEFTPVLLMQLQDDLARSRLREAFWISLVVHLLVIMTIVLGPKFVPNWAHWGKPVRLASAEDLISGKDATFLELPADEQKLTERPKQSKYISDKDRIATSRTPQLDKKALEMLRNAQRPGVPAPPVPAAPQGQQRQEIAKAMAPSGGAAAQPAPSDSSNNSNFNLPAQPNRPNPFNVPMSAGTSITEAARATARGGSSGGGGGGGDFGFGGGGAGRLGNVDILSDTEGVDFGPYLARVVESVRMNWYNLIPEVARAPLMKNGKLAIQFVITKDGKVAGMQLIAPSGDVALDRAAWGGITASNPFPPLPNQFRGPYLALRFRFYYNPRKGELE